MRLALTQARLKGELMNRQLVSCRLQGCLTFVVCAVLTVGYLQAQVDTGSITGTVTDASGAVVGGAKVTLTNEGTGTSLSSNTGADGIYEFSPVRIGSYTVDVSATGFKKALQSHIAVDVSARVLLNFKLEAGAVSETVEVTTTPPALQAEDASVGQVIDQRSVNDLPLNGRNFTFLAQLAAGVNTPQADTRGNAASGAFTANGNRPAQNNYLLDGIDNNSDTVDFLNGTNFVVLPPVDAIQEFKVQTADFGAEYGRSGAAVLNATIKRGTNQFHGALWEFFRNDKLDAADYFEDAGGIPKGELRQNQFGFAIGGPVIKNKIFFFGDYEGLRRVQGTILTGSVPTVAERSSAYTDFSDLITGQSSSPTLTDLLGRTMPTGTILDPSTTRPVDCGVADYSGITVPCTGTQTTGTPIGYARDPFGTCPATTTAFTLSGCGLNNLTAAAAVGRLDMNAITLLNLYPMPTNTSLFSNFANSPKLFEHSNSFDTNLDFNVSQKDDLYLRFSYKDDPEFIPGIFGGVADGGAFQQGNQTAIGQQSAVAYTHVFSPSLVNVARVGFNYLNTTRAGPEASNFGLPAQYGILGIPQVPKNGGLPAFGINGLATLGSNSFLPSDEVSSTFQVTDDLTKIYGKHTFKMGFEWQHVKFSTLQPSWSHGEFDYNGNFAEIPAGAPDNSGDQGNLGRAAFLLTPIPAQNGGTINDVGGSTNIYASNIFLTDDGKNYYGTYFNDDWKITPKLTVNLGLRWDFFTLVYDHHGGQANFVPSGAPTGAPMYILPGSTNANDLSSSFTNLLTADGIGLDITNKYGKGLGNSQKGNFAPRVGFAYQATPKLVVRGGWGLFFNGFENRGYSPNLGENYPFQFNFNYTPPNDGNPISFAGNTTPGCTTSGGTPTFETGFSCTPLVPTAVLANGLQLRGIQFNYQTPYSTSGNFTVQYQLTPTVTVQAAYVNSLSRHLESFPNSNNPTAILPTGTQLTNTAGPDGAPGSGAWPASEGGIPFPDFGNAASYAATIGNSFYNGLQTKVEKRLSQGLNFLATYTWSQTRTDAGDLLNGGSNAGFRVPDVPGLGIHYDYGLADFDIRNVFHLSGGYELPFGKGKPYLGSNGIASKAFGGWSVNAILVLEGGQPITLSCPSNTSSGSGCYDLIVPGQAQDRGIHIDSNGKVSFFGNPAAFSQPAPCTALPCPTSTLGGPPDQLAGPTFKRFDFSAFKQMMLTERFRLEFRAEFFNIFNHPNFNAPNFGGNGVVAVSGSGNFMSSTFGEIGSTRDAPYDPRQIQFALKLYF
jgi:hypothetical protein